MIVDCTCDDSVFHSSVVLRVLELGKKTMENTGKSIGSSILIVSVLIRTPFCWIILRSSPLVMCFPGCSMLIGRAGRRLLNHWIAFITDPF